MQENHFQDEINRDIKARKAAHDILGVEKDAPTGELKKAWRAACKKHHPDRNDDPDARGRFILADCAYRYLTDDKSCQDMLLKYYDKVGENSDRDDRPDNEWAFFLWWKDRFF